jgi:saccharopine dehydrogenase-like NADP-dependent oxidoreductase
MSSQREILVIGGYGEVGRRLAAILETAHPGAVIVGGRNPVRAGGLRSRRVDVDDETSIDSALEGVDTVVACVRQKGAQLLQAAVRRGIAYTSIAPPWMMWPEIEPLDAEAKKRGARIVLAAGIEPGISSVLARIGADRLGGVDAIETALLLGVGDAYGGDSLVFLFEELAQEYRVFVDGRHIPAHAFDRSKRVSFPSPIGERRVYPIPFRDQLYYPRTLGARTAVAWIALDPPWLGRVISTATRVGARAVMSRGPTNGALHRLTEKLRARYSDRDRFALVVEVRRGDRVLRSTLSGRHQAQATAIGAAAIAEALFSRETNAPGVWLAEQAIAPEPFLARLTASGLEPAIEEVQHDEVARA